ncbi:MAG: site-specific integrase [Candidatus Bathyarchaeia archaeon]
MAKKTVATQILNSKPESRIKIFKWQLKAAVHFNRTLSRGPGNRYTAVFKWKIRAKIKAALTNGGSHPHLSSADAIVIRRVDVLKVHDYARRNCCLRDYLLIRLPMKIGLRTGEICSLRVENIDFNNRSFHVLDSKRKRLYPLPLDPITLDLIKELVEGKTEGYVFTRTVYSRSWSHKKAGKPLHVSTVEARVKKIAYKAGVKGFTPRVLRHYFAAEWHRAGKSLELLRRILRHKSLAYTQFYLSRLVFFEDLQREYESLQAGPLAGWEPTLPVQTALTRELLPEICRTCPVLPVCKYADKMPEWATGCRFHPKQKEVV